MLASLQMAQKKPEKMADFGDGIFIWMTQHAKGFKRSG
jgi:hypothetical protein